MDTTTYGQNLRNRRLVAGAVVMLLVASGIFGSLFYLQRRAQVSHNNVKQQIAARNRRSITTPEQKAEALARVKVLREKWRPWAVQHKTELQKMLRASPNDKTALASVWNVLPDGPDANLSAEDLVPGGDPTTASAYSWGPSDKAIAQAVLRDRNPDTKEVILKGMRAGEQSREDDFMAHRDVVLSTSLNTGRTHIYLWASGRVTERTRIPPEQRQDILRKVRARGGSVRETDLYGPHQEVVPPYDFLQAP